MTQPPYELSWDARNPGELNYVRQTGFKLDITMLPQVSFFCQSVLLPGVTLGTASQKTPLADINWPGDKLTYGPFMIKFIVQADCANFIELYNWFLGLGDPVNNNQYTSWLDAHTWASTFPGTKNAQTVAQQFSDATLSILDGSNNVKTQFRFTNIFPTSMDGVQFDISSGEADYATCNVVFNYQYYFPVKLNTGI